MLEGDSEALVLDHLGFLDNAVGHVHVLNSRLRHT